MIPIYYDHVPEHARLFAEDIADGKPISIIETDRDITIDSDYNRCEILATTSLFSCALNRRIRWLIAYNPRYNLNIEPPVIPQHKKAVWEVLHTVADIATYPELPDSHYAAISLLPSGYSVADIFPYVYPAIPFDVPNYKRLPYWMSGTVDGSEVLVHPIYHRPLTTDEMIALYADTSYNWLQRQADLYLCNAWKSQNFESTYSDGAFHGKHFDTITDKTFNLLEMCPVHIPATVDYVQCVEPYKFNIDATTGQLIRNWNIVQQAFSQYQLSEHKYPISD